ncbi:MAG: hypothetical protein RSB05_03165 [Clostridiales bacterium]
MNSAEKINRLNEIYAKSEGDGESIAFLCRCFYDEDYLVRCRSFALGEIMGCSLLSPCLVKLIFSDEEREWQLRGLSLLSKFGNTEDIAQLKPLLFQRDKPLLMRGALWLMASAQVFEEDFVMATLKDFANSPFACYLKPNFLGNAFALALSRCSPHGKFLNEDGKNHKLFTFYLGFATENSLLQIYPYPDYLTKMAAKRDINPKELKNAMYFKRKKPEKTPK